MRRERYDRARPAVRLHRMKMLDVCIVLQRQFRIL